MSDQHRAPPFVPLEFRRLEPAAMVARAREFRAELAARRSVRHFSADPIPSGVLDDCIATAGSAPSGAHREPWTFVVVTDPALKHELRVAAEEEERKLYTHRITDEWRAALAPLGTDWRKEYLDVAPALIVVFRHAFDIGQGGKVTNYYTHESVGIAVGLLIAALHHAGLASLVHTPSPMGFLQRVLGRPEHEKAYVLIPVGYPAPDCEVPNLVRKPLDAIRVLR